MAASIKVASTPAQTIQHRSGWYFPAVLTLFRNHYGKSEITSEIEMIQNNFPTCKHSVSVIECLATQFIRRLYI